MSVCRVCNAPIVWAELEVDESGTITLDRIALDAHEQVGGTYRVEDGRAVEILPGATTLAFQPHECAAAVRRGVPG